MEKNINIGWTSGDPDFRILSNFAPTPFDLDSSHYGCVEAFWQSLKLQEDSPERCALASLTEGYLAKKMGAKAPASDRFAYLGRTFLVGSREHHILGERAIRAKTASHLDVQTALLATGSATLVHRLVGRSGHPVPDSVTLPGAVFCDILMRIRDELIRGIFSPDLDIPMPNAPQTYVAPPELTLFDV